MTKTPAIRLGAIVTIALAMGMLIVGCSDSDDAASADSPPTSALAPDATPLSSAALALVDPGSYRVESLGTPFTLTLSEALFVQPVGTARFVLTDRTSQGPGDRGLMFARFTALSDPTRPTTPIAELDEPWPADDFDGWLDNLSDDVIATDRQQTQIGGRDAIRVDLEFGDLDCGFERFGCVAFATNHFAVFEDMNAGSRYRIWFIDQGDQDPIYLRAGINDDSDAEWFDRADTVLASVAFGDSAPNPIVEYPAGSIELPYLGGIRTDLSVPTVMVDDARGFAAATVGTQPGGTEFLANPSDTDATALTTTTDLLAALEAANVDIATAEPTTIDGLDAQTFDITSTSGASALVFDPESEFGWFAPPQGRMWVVEHPERGLLIITAWAWADLDTAFPAIVDQTEAIVDSLEFIDPS